MATTTVNRMNADQEDAVALVVGDEVAKGGGA